MYINKEQRFRVGSGVEGHFQTGTTFYDIYNPLGSNWGGLGFRVGIGFLRSFTW